VQPGRFSLELTVGLTDGLTHGHSSARSQSGIQRHAPGRKCHDHGRTHIEAAHFLTTRKRDTATRIIHRCQAARPAGRNFSSPHGFDAAHVERPNQNQRHDTGRSLEFADHSFIPRKQPGNAAYGCRIDAEQAAGEIDHASQLTINRHMDAMVVIRRKVYRAECATGQCFRQLREPKQILQRVVSILGLEHPAIQRQSTLADGAIHRADNKRR